MREYQVRICERLGVKFPGLLGTGALAAASTLAGDPDRAQRAVARIREREPTACISDFEERMPFHRSEHLVRKACERPGYRSDPQPPRAVGVAV